VLVNLTHVKEDSLLKQDTQSPLEKGCLQTSLFVGIYVSIVHVACQ